MQRRSLWASSVGRVVRGGRYRHGPCGSAAGPTGSCFHVGSADPAMMGVALHNIANAADYYFGQQSAGVDRAGGQRPGLHDAAW